MPMHNRTLILWVLLAAHSISTFASSITPEDSSTTLVAGSSYPADFLYISPPNSLGYSFNRFSEFVVDGKPLSIINPGSTSTRPSTIVIIADDIALKNTVEVIGDAADIVFLAPGGSGLIECLSCVVKNTFRVTMVTATGDPSTNNSQLGSIDVSTQDTGNIRIDNLHAPGALNVDIMSASVETSGTISLHQSVKKDVKGGYTTDDNGSLSMGTGALLFITGANKWDYQSQTLLGTDTSFTRGSKLSGNYRALAVKLLHSTRLLEMDAYINTTTDAVASVRYLGNVKLAQEQVQINTFASTGTVLLDNLNIHSNGRVVINSVRSLVLATSTKIEGREIELISEGSVINYGRVSGGEISIAGSNATNTGWLSADRELEIFATYRIVNRHGGQMLADIVSLETGSSSSSFVANGARVPSTFVATLSLQSKIDENYFDRIDHTKVGTFYTLGLDDNIFWTWYDKPTNTAAHIRGRKIYITSSGFENINPYYEFIDEFDEYLAVDRTLLNQVSVIAEDTLNIDAEHYILNSSAFLGTEGVNSKVHLETNALVNERYRILPVLDLDYYSQTGQYIETGNWVRGEPVDVQETTTTERIETKMATFSPPGVLYSMGDFELTSDEDTASSGPRGAFVNSVGYFEVFGDATFYTKEVIDAGIENQGITLSETVRSYTISVGNNVSTQQYVTNPEEMDSLFYVAGVARASQTEVGRHLNLSPFKGYLAEALDQLMDNYSFVGTGNSLTTPSAALQVLQEDPLSYGLSSTLNLDGSMVGIEDTFSISWYESKTYEVRIPGDHYETSSVTRSNGSTDDYSIFDELKKLFNNLVDSFIEAFNEIKWW